MRSIGKSDCKQEDGSLAVSELSAENMDKIRHCWPSLQKKLEDSGKIRLLAAMSHSSFDAGTIVVKVANVAIQQEVLESRADIQQILLDLTGLKVGIRVEVTPDVISVGRPVSDSQRLQAIVKKQPEVKLLCELLKLKL